LSESFESGRILEGSLPTCSRGRGRLSRSQRGWVAAGLAVT
jgi:hypothetical protein